MKKLNLKLGLKAIDKKIKFQYTIEDSIADAQMFVVISVLEAIKEKIKLEDIISVFCKGKENDQYKLMQSKFIDIFKDDNIKSFDDFKKVEKRAIEILKKGSMILDANASVDIIYLKEIERYIFNINSLDYYLSEKEIKGFIKDNLQKIIRIDENKKPKFKDITVIEDETETRIIEIDSKINHKLDKIYIQNEEYSKTNIINIAREEIRNKSIASLEKIPSKIHDIKEIKKISDDLDILTMNPIQNEKIIVDWNESWNNKSDSIVTYGNGNINLYKFFEYKKIIVYSQEKISILDLINLIKLKEFNKAFSKEITMNISKELSNSNQLRIIDIYSKENDGLDISIEDILLEKIGILIEFESPLISYLTIYNKIISDKLIDKSKYYKLIHKHYKKDINYNDDKIIMFLYRVHNESTNLLLKKEKELVLKMMEDKEGMRDKYSALLGEAAKLRTTLNKLIEDKNEFISNKKTQNMADEIRKYLNTVNHINEDHSNKLKIISDNPELKEWIRISKNEYNIEDLSHSHIDKLENKFIMFGSNIKLISKNIEESIKDQAKKDTPE